MDSNNNTIATSKQLGREAADVANPEPDDDDSGASFKRHVLQEDGSDASSKTHDLKEDGLLSEQASAALITCQTLLSAHTTKS